MRQGRAKRGKAGRVEVWLGVAREAGRCKARSEAEPGGAWRCQAGRGKAWLDEVGCVVVR